MQPNVITYNCPVGQQGTNDTSSFMTSRFNSANIAETRQTLWTKQCDKDAPSSHITALKTMNGSEAALHSEHHTKYEGGLTSTSPLAIWFWAAVIFVKEFEPQAIGMPTFVDEFVPHAIGIPVFVEEFVPQAIGIHVFVEELVPQAIEVTPQSLRRPRHRRQVDCRRAILDGALNLQFMGPN